ncbi:MAG: Trx7/PDZ domain-containing (seleno)protein [Pirellula sp.]
MTQSSRWLLFVAFLIFTSAVHGDEKNRREKAVRDDQKSLSNDTRWLYNDLETGFDAAKKLNKPLLVVLRCVPCKACTGLDESVLRAKELQPQLDHFVCVRLINANAIDLSKFQFDYDLSFSTLVFHPEGKLIGRYGSWQHQLDDMETSTASLHAMLRKSKLLFDDWGSVENRLSLKQGGPTPFQLPIEIPGLAGKYERELKWEGNVVQSCVHCHQIGDAFRAWHRRKGEAIPQELIYPMPDPKTIGLMMEQKSGTTVRSVQPDGLAAAAGLQKDDEILAIDDAPITSLADIAWALHRSKDIDTKVISVLRNGASTKLTLELPAGWRTHSDISSRVGTWQMRAMALGGMHLKSLDDTKRKSLGLQSQELGLVVHGLGEYGEHAAAKRAGFHKGDVIVALEGIHAPIDESRLIGTLLLSHVTPTQLSATVLRNGERLNLQWPIQ